MRCTCILVTAALLFAPAADAHVVPKGTFDRTITITIHRARDGGTLFIRYRLEVDELTLLLDELPKLKKLDIELNPIAHRGEPLKFYADFMRHYDALLSANLLVRVNDEPVKLMCIERTPRLHDDNGDVLGHLRCEFVFRGDFAARPGEPCTLSVREGNYEDKRGIIRVGLLAMPVPRLAANTVAQSTLNPVAALGGVALASLTPGVRIFHCVEPGAAQRKLSEIDRDPQVDEQFRNLRAEFEVLAAHVPPAAPVVLADTPSMATGTAAEHNHGLLPLLLHSNYSVALLLLIFAGVGAVHALTPGHGKTLVAAYLVGQRGTIWHALVLGLVTTLTHTGVVLIFAAALNFVPEQSLVRVQAGLGLAMGLAIICLGFWLLMKRLSGGADHIHIGGGHHHHHHGGTHTHHHAAATDVTWWNLLVLGMTGGIIPCWDAVAILALCVGRGQMWLALPLVLAFSAGLAGVLVLIGILVVKVRSFASSRVGEGRLTRVLPLVSAVVIMAVGFWLCYESVH